MQLKLSGISSSRMRFLICSLLLVASQFVATSSVIADEEAPKISLPASEYKFGTVTQGTVVQHEFEIKNVGSKELLIHRVVPACGCTAAVVDNEAIAPGASGKLKVTFDTTGFASGTKSKSIRLYTNDPDRSSSILRLSGKVESDITVLPKRVDLGEVVRGESAETEVAISVRKDSKSEISNIKTFSKLLEVSPLKEVKGSKVFTVRLKDDAPIGELRERVIIGLKGAKRQSINVPVYARVVGTVKVKPSTLSFGIIEGSQPLKRSVKVENLGSDPISIAGVRTDNAAVSTQLKTIKKGKIYVLHVEVNPASIKNDLRASVEINLANSSEKLAPLTVSVFGITPPKS